MPVANNRLLTDDTGLALVNAIERIAPLQIAPLVVSIPTGQWSGSGNDYYISVSASNVTANSILVPNYDNESAAYLKGPVWCVPAAGSFTIHTSVVPSGTVNIMVQFPGTMGEANYQVLADVYSKSQAVAKTDIVNNLTSTLTDKPLSAAQGKGLNDKIYLLENAPQIANGTDLNTVDTEGRWWASGGNGCTNAPPINAFGLLVFRSATGYIRQVAIEGDGDRIFVRRKNKNNNAFGNWEELVLKSDISKLPLFEKNGVIAANGGTVTVSNENADAIFIVAIGGWNYSQLFTVMTTNGGAPKKALLASYTQGSTDFPITASGSWGFIITNNTSYAQTYSIYKIRKNF